MGINLCAQVNRNNHRSLSFDPEDFPDLTPENDSRYDIDCKGTLVGVNAARQGTQLKQCKGDPVFREPGVRSQPVSPLKQPRFGGRCRQLSLAEKIQERRKNPNSYDDFVEGEHQAKMYINKIEDNSMKQLTETFETVGSMLEKETAIQNELKRQGEIVNQANRDVRAAEKDIDDTSHRLRGMRSLGGKVASLVSRRAHVKSAPASDSDHESENNFPPELTESMTSLPSLQPNQSKQEWLCQGVGQLCSLLDVVETKQLDIGHELEKQHETMKILDENIDNIECKIGHQTNLMKSITK